MSNKTNRLDIFQIFSTRICPGEHKRRICLKKTEANSGCLEGRAPKIQKSISCTHCITVPPLTGHFITSPRSTLGHHRGHFNMVCWQKGHAGGYVLSTIFLSLLKPHIHINSPGTRRECCLGKALLCDLSVSQAYVLTAILGGGGDGCSRWLTLQILTRDLGHSMETSSFLSLAVYGKIPTEKHFKLKFRFKKK